MLRFAFLLMEEHPYGRIMLRTLLQRGHRPGLVLEETSEAANEERRKFLRRIDGQQAPPPLGALLAGSDIPRAAVDSHNGPACTELLVDFRPDLLVLGGTGIIRPSILSIPSRGTVNAHPGLLPRLRGSSSVAWALYKDLPIGSTVHLVDANIDTGDIILRRRLGVRRGESYEQIVHRVIHLSADLMAETLNLFERGTPPATPQELVAGETLRVIPEQLLVQAKARLAEGRYSHFEK
jgi:methionyl-tRNA formyltransferase